MNRGSRVLWIAILALLASAGALVKTVGGLIYGSMALFVDGLTCIANLAALAGSIVFERYRWIPPDADHQYGHHRLALGGVLVVLIVYSFVAGFSVRSIIAGGDGYVDPRAPLAAALGLAFYAPSIIIARRLGGSFAAYGVFTVSEVIESMVSIAGSAGGAFLDPVVDRIGAAVVVAYILYEIYDVARDYINKVSDVAPRGLGDIIRREVESKLGVRVDEVRLRVVDTDTVFGDMVIKVPADVSVREAHAVATLAEKLASKYNVRLVVHVEPEEAGRGGLRRKSGGR